jgi:hypothetical protein
MSANEHLSLGDHVVAAVGRGRSVDEDVRLSGRVHVSLYGPDGRLKDERNVDNLVVTAGKNHIADQLSASPGEGAMSHMAIGTSATAASAGQTALVAEIDRNALTSRTDSAGVVTYVGDWAAGDGTNAGIQEAGIFNASSSGTMLARAVFTSIDKQAGDTLSITWTVTLSVP